MKIISKKENTYRYHDAFKKETLLLQERIGYKFKNPLLLYEALTHSSFSNEYRTQRNSMPPYNERLEFLGDSVLSVTVAEYIFTKLFNFPEGELTRIRAFAVCEDALYAYSNEIELGKFLLLGHGEEKTDGRRRKSILADAFEAVIGALYIDGGLDAASDFVLEFATRRIDDYLTSGISKDYKSHLQQIVQVSRGDVLEYALVTEEGPAHDRTFTVAVSLNSNKIGTGSGRTKRQAEQMAAKEALKLFGEKV